MRRVKGRKGHREKKEIKRTKEGNKRETILPSVFSLASVQKLVMCHVRVEESSRIDKIETRLAYWIGIQ
jgi:hypothetical protein